MLIAFLLPGDNVKVYDTAEVPAMYILHIGEAENITQVHIAKKGTGGQNIAFHLSVDAAKNKGFRDPIKAEVLKRKMMNALAARPVVHAYTSQRYAAQNAENVPQASIIEKSGG